jgi:tripartite-type tricarboxylate transporter receptor subunit TctC
VQIALPFAAGSSADMAARIPGEQIGQTLGQGVIVVNPENSGGKRGAVCQQTAAATIRGVVADPYATASWNRKGAAPGNEDAVPLLGGPDMKASQ